MATRHPGDATAPTPAAAARPANDRGQGLRQGPAVDVDEWTQNQTDRLPAGRVDRRRERGVKRRADIIAATLAVIARDGAAAVSHRSVARQAGTTVSLSTYYFATIDDLLVAALTDIAEEYSRAIADIVERSGDLLGDFAELVASSSGAGRRRALAERELATLAARRPALRPIALGWRQEVAALARTYTDDEQAVAAVVATADGLCAAILLEDAPADAERIRGVLQAALQTAPQPAQTSVPHR